MTIIIGAVFYHFTSRDTDKKHTETRGIIIERIDKVEETIKETLDPPKALDPKNTSSPNKIESTINQETQETDHISGIPHYLTPKVQNR